METNSRDGQDLLVLMIFGNAHIGSFVDVGCYLPIIYNNTYLLEKNGWHGISIDKRNFTEEWKQRKTPFLIWDALSCDYQQLFNTYGLPKIIDYLSVDIDGQGHRFATLKKVFESGHEFKLITLEHEACGGYELTERKVQREFLTERGYLMIASNVMCSAGPFEDWWINPKYIHSDELFIESKYPNEIFSILNNKIKLL
jgi:hypothetical protein